MRPDQLSNHLNQSLAPLYVLHGDEPLLIIEAADAIRASAKQRGYSEREILVAGQGFKWRELAMAAGNLSLFGAAKLIDLRIPTGKPGREGGEALQNYCKQLDPQNCVTLITLPQLDWTVRKSAWFTALAEVGEVLELNTPSLAALPQWLNARLAKQKQHAAPDALEFIALHVEGNLLAAQQEILKLGLLYPEGEISFAQIQDAVLHVARYDTDKLREAFLQGDIVRCSRLLEGLRAEGAAPLFILWTLSNEIRALANLRSGMDNGGALPSLFKTERIFDSTRQKLMGNLLKSLRTSSLRAAIAHAAKIDRIIKGIAPGQVWDEFSRLCLRVTQN